MSVRMDPAGGRTAEYSGVARSETMLPVEYSMDLPTSIEHLARLPLGLMGLDEILTQIVTLAKKTVPGVGGVGMIVIETDRPNTTCFSDDVVAQLSSFETRFRQGPATSAMKGLVALHSGSLGADPRWKRFGSRAARLGVHSAISAPLVGPGHIIGVLNVYAKCKHAFDGHVEQICRQFGEYASIVLLNALCITQEQRLNAVLRAALVTRPKIDQAIGILMSRSGGTEEEVFDRLREVSQREHTKLATVAAEIVEQARRSAATRAGRGRYGQDLAGE